MKQAITFLFIIFTFAANALSLEVPTSIVGTAEDVLCGEIDPFAVGDACVVFTTDEETGIKFGLLYHDYDWIEAHVPDTDDSTDMIGDRFVASSCTKMFDRNKINELRDYKSDYFYIDCTEPAETFSWVYPEDTASFAELTELAQERLVKYLIHGTYIDEGDDPVSALDSDDITEVKIRCSNGEVYDSIVVYSGDTPHGPLYKLNSLELVGEHGDGDTRLYTKEWVDCSEL